MTYGLSITNGSSGLVVSTDAKLMHYLAKPNLESIVQPSGSSGSVAPGYQSGYSTYLVTIPGDVPFVLAAEIPVGLDNISIFNVNALGSGVYRIFVYNAYGSPTLTQHAVTLWAFGYVGSVSGDYGLVLYSADGSIAADFTRNNPMIPRGIVSIGTSATGTVPSLTRPVVVSMPIYFNADIHPNGGSGGFLYTYRKEIGSWNRPNSSDIVVKKVILAEYQVNAFPTDDDAQFDGTNYAVVLEGAMLP